VNGTATPTQSVYIADRATACHITCATTMCNESAAGVVCNKTGATTDMQDEKNDKKL
jgi:hypothetical protein